MILNYFKKIGKHVEYYYYNVIENDAKHGNDAKIKASSDIINNASINWHAYYIQMA